MLESMKNNIVILELVFYKIIELHICTRNGKHIGRPVSDHFINKGAI